MKNKLILLLGGVCLALFCGSSSEPISANGENESNQTSIPIEGSESEGDESIPLDTLSESEGTEESEQEASSSESEAKKNYFEDKDEDGIPDAIEDYYDAHIREQYMFGIGLGSILSVAIMVLYYLFKSKKDKAWKEMVFNEIKESIKSQKDVVFHKDEQIDTLHAFLDTRKAESDETISDMREIKDDIKKCAENSASYEVLSKQNEAILKCLSLMTNSEDCVKKGISAEMNDIINEVKEDGEN